MHHVVIQHPGDTEPTVVSDHYRLDIAERKRDQLQRKHPQARVTITTDDIVGPNAPTLPPPEPEPPEPPPPPLPTVEAALVYTDKARNNPQPLDGATLTEGPFVELRGEGIDQATFVIGNWTYSEKAAPFDAGGANADQTPKALELLDGTHTIQGTARKGTETSTVTATFTLNRGVVQEPPQVSSRGKFDALIDEGFDPVNPTFWDSVTKKRYPMVDQAAQDYKAFVARRAYLSTKNTEHEFNWLIGSKRNSTYNMRHMARALMSFERVTSVTGDPENIEQIAQMVKNYQPLFVDKWADGWDNTTTTYEGVTVRHPDGFPNFLDGYETAHNAKYRDLEINNEAHATVFFSECLHILNLNRALKQSYGELADWCDHVLVTQDAKWRKRRQLSEDASPWRLTSRQHVAGLYGMYLRRARYYDSKGNRAMAEKCRGWAQEQRKVLFDTTPYRPFSDPNPYGSGFQDIQTPSGPGYVWTSRAGSVSKASASAAYGVSLEYTIYAEQLFKNIVEATLDANMDDFTHLERITNTVAHHALVKTVEQVSQTVMPFHNVISGQIEPLGGVHSDYNLTWLSKVKGEWYRAPPDYNKTCYGCYWFLIPWDKTGKLEPIARKLHSLKPMFMQIPAALTFAHGYRLLKGSR